MNEFIFIRVAAGMILICATQLKPAKSWSRQVKRNIFSLLLSIYDAKSTGSIYLHIKASLDANRSKSILLKKLHQSCQQFYRPTQWTGKLKYFFHSCSFVQGLSIYVDAEAGFEPGYSTLPLYQTRIWWKFFRRKTFAQKKCSLDLLISTILNNFY
jgi:hypothetical protein